MNWRTLPREQTRVLGAARGPRTEPRQAPETVAALVEPQGFKTVKTFEVSFYHCGIVFEAL